MPFRSGNIAERNQHEGTLVHARVRDDEVWQVDAQTAVRDDAQQQRATAMSRMQSLDWIARLVGCPRQRRLKTAERLSHRRRLSFQTLEDRRMLAVITVDSLLDNTTNDGLITLREATVAANNDAVADATEGTQAGSGADTIEFAPALDGGTITLILGELGITESLTIYAGSLNPPLERKVARVIRTGKGVMPTGAGCHGPRPLTKPRDPGLNLDM